MANSTAGDANDYNAKIIEEFRANQGHVGGPWEGITLILVHHVGAQSGIERVNPLACSVRGEDGFAIWAANGGAPAHPRWYYNLKANPRITAEVGDQALTMLARELDHDARAQLWPKLVAQYPGLGEAQAKTTREIPVFVLTPED
jgi:deazaflavin-dependent oxidoreductase (nitroreductase family)